MQHNCIFFLRTTIDHKFGIILTELLQFLNDRCVFDRIQCGQRVFNVASQKILERLIHRCCEHNFTQFRCQFIPLGWLLIFHCKRNGMEFGQRLQHGYTFVEAERRRTIGILEAQQTQIVQQHIFILVRRAGGQNAWIVLENVSLFQMLLLELLKRGENVFIHIVFAGKVAGAVINLPTEMIGRRQFGNQSQFTGNLDNIPGREKRRTSVIISFNGIWIN